VNLEHDFDFAGKGIRDIAQTQVLDAVQLIEEPGFHFFQGA
jgi:hypothetical protein